MTITTVKIRPIMGLKYEKYWNSHLTNGVKIRPIMGLKCWLVTDSLVKSG